MKTKAAVAFEAGKPLEVIEVDLEGPKEGEVLVEIRATGICHTDEFTLSGADPEGIFPAILGHEGAGVVVDVGPGVTTLKKRAIMLSRFIRLSAASAIIAPPEKPICVKKNSHHARTGRYA